MTRYISKMEQCIRQANADGAFQGMTTEQVAVVGATLDIVECSRERLICQDDEGLIRATNGSATVIFTPSGGESEFDVTLDALGLEYCLNIGLATVGTYAKAWDLQVIRAGNVVGSFTDAMLVAATANSTRAAMCPCNICVGAIQSVKLRWRGLGGNFAAGDTLTLQVCRTFGGDCTPKVACGKGC